MKLSGIDYDLHQQPINSIEGVIRDGDPFEYRFYPSESKSRDFVLVSPGGRFRIDKNHDLRVVDALRLIDGLDVGVLHRNDELLLKEPNLDDLYNIFDRIFVDSLELGGYRRMLHLGNSFGAILALGHTVTTVESEVSDLIGFMPTKPDTLARTLQHLGNDPGGNQRFIDFFSQFQEMKAALSSVKTNAYSIYGTNDWRVAEDQMYGNLMPISGMKHDCKGYEDVVVAYVEEVLSLR